MPTINPHNPFYEAVGAIEDSNRAVATELGLVVAEQKRFTTVFETKQSELIAALSRQIPGAKVAFLYLGVDVNGTFSRASRAGKALGAFLGTTCGKDNLLGIAEMEREAFVKQARAVANQHPFLQEFDNEDYGRFHDLSRGVWELTQKK